MVAIQDNGKILTCWCCNHAIPTACAWNKSTKNEIEPKRISDAEVRKRRILVIKMVRLENSRE